jgi:hypothetical protein
MHAHVIYLVASSFCSRTMATSSSPSNPPPPAERAAEIIDKLPSHPSLITKTGTAILGSGLLATAISQELYVFNEETVIAVGYLILFAYIAKVRTLLRGMIFNFQNFFFLWGAFRWSICEGDELPLFIVVESNRMDADRNMHVHDCRPSAFRTRSGRRTTLLASRACSTARVTSTHRL